MSAFRDLITPFLQYWYKGDTGDTGTSDNTYTPENGGLAAFKASDITRATASLVGIPDVPDQRVYWSPGDHSTTRAEDLDVSVFKADSTPLSQGAWVRQGASGVRLAQGGNVDDAIQYVTPQMFMTVAQKLSVAFGIALLDVTKAIQTAIDTGRPVRVPKGKYKISKTLLCDPGLIFEGDGGVANYDESPVKFHVEPAVKCDLFNWRNPRANAPYEFAGTRITGFCVRGYGPGVDACVDLPLLYNGKIDFFAYTGIDVWMRLRRWMDTKVSGGAQGFRTFGVHFANAGSDDTPSDVTTSTTIDAYLSQGPIAYYAADRAVTKCTATGVIESVDNATNMARGNIFKFIGMTENVPRTDAGSAWVYGKTGTAPFWQTALTVELQDGIGHTGGTLDNANAFDVGHVRLLKVSGYVYNYRSLLKTTAHTARVSLIGLDTASINLLSPAGGVANYGAIVGAGFTPEYMKVNVGDEDLFDGSMVSPTLMLWSQDRLGMGKDRLFLDANLGNKLVYHDRYGNYTAPIGALRVSGTSEWKIKGARLSPGELVQNENVTLGEPGLWISTRHSKDEGNIYPGCTTVADSRVITHPIVGAFHKCEIGDYVTVSDGYGDAVAQRRVIDRTPDLTSITLDSAAIFTVVASVVVATEAHKLIPLAQQGHREVGVNPTGMLTPNFRGEEVFRTDTFNWYKATGFTKGDWKLIT